MNVQESWDVIHKWLDKESPNIAALLGEPADPSALSRLESEIGHALPDGFKASYLIHDGSDPMSGPMAGLPLMSIDVIRSNWEMWAEVADEGCEDLDEPCQSHPTDAVKLLYANRNWIPFCGDSQNFVALDFDPGANGKYGQVINTGRDDEIRHVIAETFDGFLAFVAGLFSAGQVEVVADVPDENPPWLCLTEGKGDLLTDLRDLLGLRH